MEASIWTQFATYFGCESLVDALTGLGELGWRCFELSTEHLQAIEDAADRPAQIDAAAERLASLGAAMPQAHAYLQADVAAVDEARRAADVDRVERNLRTCAAVGAGVVVMHPGSGGGYTTERQRERIARLNREQFRRLGDLAGELGLRIAIENMADGAGLAGRRAYGAVPAELLELLASLDHPAVGLCLDTSHANLQRLDLPGAIGELAPHLIATHLSDNDGTGDQHLIPGHGQIDWPAAMAALGRAGYDGPMNLEIPGERCSAPEMVRMKARYARDVTDWLIVQAGGASRPGRDGAT